MKTGCLPAGFDQFSEKILKEVFAPTVVGVPPEDASRGLVRLPNGEIRHYGEYFSRGRWEKCYVESLDCGLNWRMRPAQEESVGAAFLSPASGHWLLLDSNGFAHHYLGRHLVHRMPKLGTYLFRSTAGIDGPFTCEHISEREYQILRPPLHLLSRHRWLLPTQYRRKEDGHMVAVALLSDDDWATCREVDLPTAPRHQVKPPHKGLRWQNDACEPSVVELPGGRLWCLLRTSQDFFYETYSEDGGNTWSEGRPSRFSNTITMPTLLSLSDGRLLLLWCNTAPLPEPDHRVFFGLKENV